MSDEPDVLSIRDIYQEIGTNFRYFLTWRHRLFAGYLAVLAGMSVAFWTVGEDRLLRLAVAPAAAVLTSVFWVLEVRNRDLYHACLNSAQACETSLRDGVGIYTRLNSNQDVRGKPLTHSRALDALYLCVIIAAIALEGCLIWG